MHHLQSQPFIFLIRAFPLGLCFLDVLHLQVYMQTANHSHDFRCSTVVFEPGEDDVSAAMRRVVDGARFPIFLAVRLVSLAQASTVMWVMYSQSMRFMRTVKSAKGAASTAAMAAAGPASNDCVG